MKVLIIGASGRTGKELLKQSLAQGFEVVAYVRRSKSIKSQANLQVFVGDIEDVEKMSHAAVGVEAIFVALGNPITNLNAPLMQKAVPTVIKVTKKQGIKRVIWLSALGVGETIKNVSGSYKLLARTILKGNYKDHHLGESLFNNSNLNWTTVHPGPLFNGPRTTNPLVKDAASGYKMPLFPRTNRSDVAAVMIKLINEKKSFQKQMLITSALQTN